MQTGEAATTRSFLPTLTLSTVPTPSIPLPWHRIAPLLAATSTPRVRAMTEGQGAKGRRHIEGQGHAHNNQIDHAEGGVVGDDDDDTTTTTTTKTMADAVGGLATG